MAQPRGKDQPPGKMSATSRATNREILDPSRELVTQLGSISSQIEQNVRDLSQPMTIILGLNDLILPQIEPGSKLAADLVGVTKQINRLSQIVAEVNDLVEERKKLLKVLGGLPLSTARLDGEVTSHNSMRKEQEE